MSILTANQRNHLRRSEFAIPETRSYPIHDERHARNALSRVAQFGSAEEKARVRTAVHRKFPSIGSQPRAAVPHGKKGESIGHRIVAMGRRSPSAVDGRYQ